MKIKGIRYTGPIFDNSGYARACRGNIMALYHAGVPLNLNPISFEKASPDFGEDGRILKSLVDNGVEYNVNIIHSTPEFWAKYKINGMINIGYTIWETTKLHSDWPKYINNNVDKVLVGCSWNEDVFKESGVTIPIGVVPHGINMKEFDNVSPFQISGVKEDDFMFYSIFQWCYDEETRVLTSDGYKYFKDLKYEDEIATLNPKTEELEYHKPDKIVKFRRKDKMYTLKGDFFDVCVTPDHKMVVKEKDKMAEDWKLIPFNELTSRSKKGRLIVSEKYRAKKNCKWSGEEQEIFEIPQIEGSNYPLRKDTAIEINMDIFLEFLGWYLSEGSTHKAKRGYVTTISQVKSDYRKEIVKCIEGMKFNVIEKNDSAIIFNSREMYYYLKQFGTAQYKFIPAFVKQLSSRQIKIILNSLFKGDGSLYENGEWVKYTTTSKQLAEDIQECLLKVGMSGAVSTEDPTLKTTGKIDGREIRGKLLQYIVSVNRKRNEPSMHYSDLQEIDYDGYVHCATVKNHIMLVERNGKVLFSGNTERKHPMALLKAYFSAFSGKEDVVLVLKTYRSDYSDREKEAIRETIKRLKIIMPMDHYPKIVFLPDMLTEEEITGLHARGDCYVSFDRGEGFGLSPFQSGACGNPIIVTGFGGSTEYAKEDNSYLIDYQLTPVFGMPWSPWYKGDQNWAEPNVIDGADKMMQVYKNKEEAKQKGLKLQKYISENFSWEVIANKIIKEIEEIK